MMGKHGITAAMIIAVAAQFEPCRITSVSIIDAPSIKPAKRGKFKRRNKGRK